MNSSVDKDKILEKAMERYANESNIPYSQLLSLTQSMPHIQARVASLTQREIDEIKGQIPKDELERITKILSEVK